MNSTLQPRRVSGDQGLALSGTIEPTRLSLAYRFGLVIVAIAMLLLPMLYLGLIAATTTATWWHVTTNTWIFVGKGGSQWRFLGYVTPLVVGIVLVFFMVKPILARPAKGQDPLPIEPEDQPGLFAFIDQICRQVRAPVPRRVQVDCQVNASASFRPGRFSLLKRDLVLTIGLPLAAGLSVRELGGVLAHEFGHFAQGGGMRLTALVRGINGWFARVVYERDEWDEKLDQWSKEATWQVSVVLLIARASVWVSRRVLWALMMAGHFVSCFMLRQMEYDADSYEIAFAGSAAFARTSARLRELNAGAHVGYDDLREGWLHRKLPSDLPAFLVDRSTRLPDELLSQLRRVPDAPTGSFDTHPSDADRVQAAEAAAAPGVLVGGDGPATGLFRRFDELSQAATRHHYEHHLGLSLDTATLVGREIARQESQHREEHQRALAGILGDRGSVFRPLRFSIAELESLTVMELRTTWDRARQRMAEAGDTLSERYRQYEALEHRRTQAFCGHELLNAGFNKVHAADFGLTTGTLADAAAAERSALDELRTLAPSLDDFEAAAARRLSCCVRLLDLTSTDQQTRGADGTLPARRALADEALSLVGALNILADVTADAHEMGRSAFAEDILAHNRELSARPELFDHRMKMLDGILLGRTRRIHGRLKTVPCPSAFTSEPVDAAAWCGLPPSGRPDSLSDAVGRVFTFQYWLLGRLAVIALQVEAEEAFQS
jgi:Zn-dependent protease with chaperone function